MVKVQGQAAFLTPKEPPGSAHEIVVCAVLFTQHQRKSLEIA
jgi:hypothetical protein